MNTYVPALLLVGSGGWFYYTSRHPDHANPRAARVTAAGLVLLGVGALVWTLVR